MLVDDTYTRSKGRFARDPDARAERGGAEVGDLRRRSGGEMGHAPQTLPPVGNHRELQVIELLAESRDGGEGVRVIRGTGESEAMLL
jgi:hypothetical protein